MRIFTCLALVFAFIAGVFAQAPPFITTQLDNYINEGMKAWQVPALSVVVVKDGQVVVRKGYGVANLNTKEPVDENTLFFIASNSKLFTGTALAHLETLGKLSLNDRIQKYYPDYRLYNDTSSAMVTIRDMLCHRIGTKTFQGDFTFLDGTLSREEIMYKMRYLKPTNSFRAAYGYCNSCFLTAGMVIPKVTGQSWEAFITDSIILPLGMNNTYALSNDAPGKKNNATPYTNIFSGKLTEVPYDTWDNLGPAASILSNVKDLTNWLLFQLDSGRYDGKRIMPWPSLQKTRDVNVLTNSRKSSTYPTHFVGYGLGLNVADYNGKQVYWHTGGAVGMLSNVCFVPEEKLGIAILTTNDNQSFFEALRYQILDVYLGIEGTNRSAAMLKRFEREEKATMAQIDSLRQLVTGQKPPTTLEAFEGTYTNELYGNIQVKATGKQLKVSFQHHPSLQATLSFMSGNNWLLEYNNSEYGIFKTQASVNKDGSTSIVIKANDFIEYDPYIFSKN
jgi:CubicO group peptidase (beta-lactamase class C family)